VGLIENNLLDYRGASQPCTGVDAQSIQWTIIRGNTFRYCHGSSNTGPRGIRVNNTFSWGRIDHNIFSSYYRANYCDISIAGTDTYPNRSSGYTGPYGIGNQSNLGPELPAF
jgi:hypothetical protein